MPPFKKAQAVLQAVARTMAEIDIEYIKLMQRLGCKNLTMYRF